jgi:hypothetical protein
MPDHPNWATTHRGPPGIAGLLGPGPSAGCAVASGLGGGGGAPGPTQEQPRTPVLVANITRGPDGRWTALDAQGRDRAKHTAGAVFRNALADELTEQLGVA